MPSFPPRRRLALVLATGLAALAPPAAAHAAPGTVAVNDGYELVVRAAPSSGAAAVRRLADGTKVEVVCQVHGDRVTGRFGTSTLWDRIAGGGYVSDTFVQTGSDRRVAPSCNTKAPTTPAPATPAPATPTPPPATPVSSPGPSAAKPRHGVASVTQRDDYPHKRRSPQDADKLGFFFKECTSFVAFRVHRNMKEFKNGMTPSKPGKFGNAGTWDDRARQLGFVVDKRPTKGSVYVRESGSAGHVAVVVKAEKRRVFVEQYNADGGHRYSKAWVPRAADVEFIHFDQKR